MSDVKIVAASIINFLKQQLEGDSLTVDSRESVEVSIQCLETAFDVSTEDAAKKVDLLKLVRDHLSKTALTPENRALAERLKNEGNDLMKAEKFQEALDKYNKAIEINPNNAVFYSNRAAAHSRLGDHEASVADCTVALTIQPDYSKALGRLGLALTALGKHREARSAYARASQLEPENESYKTNLRLADEQLSQTGQRPPLDFGGLLQNPALLNMATEMLSDPNMQNLISGLMGNTGAAPGAGAGVGGGANAGGMNALLEAGQALAQHMQAANPDLVEQLRRQVGARPPGGPENQPQ